MSVYDNQVLVQLVYISEVAGELLSAELMSIVHSARQWNERRHVTSALFYKDGCFGQVLEGCHDAVNMVCGRIKRDRSHHRIIQLASRPIQERLIPHHALKFYGGNGLDRKHPVLAEALVGDKGNKDNLLRLILLASIN